jgi:hypothetical protein
MINVVTKLNKTLWTHFFDWIWIFELQIEIMGFNSIFQKSENTLHDQKYSLYEFHKM